MSTTTPARVLLNIAERQGYSPAQVSESVTLGELAQLVEAAIEQFSEEASVILDNGDRYGARFGGLSRWDDLFTAPEEDDEDEV